MAVRQVIHAESTRREYRKFIGLLIFLMLVATLFSTLISFHWADWLRWFIGSFLVVFGGFKLISYETFTSVFPKYDVLGSRYSWYVTFYPLLEVFLGFCYILDLFPSERNIITLLLMGISFVGIYNNQDHRGPSRDSTTLGRLFRLPLSTSLLFEDVIVVVATVVLMLHTII